MYELKEGTIVRIMVEIDYVIPPYESDVDGTIEEWFGGRFPIGSGHAYRNSSQIKMSDAIKVEKISYADWIESIKKRKTK